MSKTGGPDLKKYLDKKLAFKLNGNRKVRENGRGQGWLFGGRQKIWNGMPRPCVRVDHDSGLDWSPLMHFEL